MHKSLQRVLVASALLFTFVAGLSAGQRHWGGSGSGNGRVWDRAAHWRLTQGGGGGAGVPTAADDAFNDGGGALQVNTNAVCLSFTQSSALGTKDFINNATLTVGAGGLTLLGGQLGSTTSGNVVTVAGNWTENGVTFSPGTMLVVFNGTVNQTVTSSSTFGDLTVNSSGGVTLASNATAGCECENSVYGRIGGKGYTAGTIYRKIAKRRARSDGLVDCPIEHNQHGPGREGDPVFGPVARNGDDVTRCGAAELTAEKRQSPRPDGERRIIDKVFCAQGTRLRKRKADRFRVDLKRAAPVVKGIVCGRRYPGTPGSTLRDTPVGCPVPEPAVSGTGTDPVSLSSRYGGNKGQEKYRNEENL